MRLALTRGAHSSVMKRIPILACLLLAALAQAAEPVATPEQQLLAALKEVQAQQVTIAENQTKIDEKIAAVVEAVRLARIYSSRSGN